MKPELQVKFLGYLREAGLPGGLAWVGPLTLVVDWLGTTPLPLLLAELAPEGHGAYPPPDYRGVIAMADLPTPALQAPGEGTYVRVEAERPSSPEDPAVILMGDRHHPVNYQGLSGVDGPYTPVGTSDGRI